jgi:hypothetical protein
VSIARASLLMTRVCGCAKRAGTAGPYRSCQGRKSVYSEDLVWGRG